MRSNGFLGGHFDLNSGHPGLEEDFFERVLVIEMLSTPLKPEVIKKKITKNVKRLPRVRVATPLLG